MNLNNNHSVALQPIEGQDLQPTAGLTFTCPQTEVYDHTSSPHVWSSSRCCFLDQDYRYKSVATQIAYDAGLASPLRIELALQPVVRVQRNSLKPRYHGAWMLGLHSNTRYKVYVSIKLHQKDKTSIK